MRFGIQTRSESINRTRSDVIGADTDYERIYQIVKETTTPYTKEPLSQIKRADDEKEVLIFTSPSLEHTDKLVGSSKVEKVDMVYIDVGVDIEKAGKVEDELRMLLSPIAKEIHEGLSVAMVKELLKMDSYEAMQFMALVTVSKISELRTPYTSHKGISREEAKRLADHGLLHIAGWKPKENKVKV